MIVGLGNDGRLTGDARKVLLLCAIALGIVCAASLYLFGSKMAMLIAVVASFVCLVLLYGLARNSEKSFFSKRGLITLLVASAFLAICVEGIYLFVAMRDHMLSVPAVSKTRMSLLFCCFSIVGIVLWSRYFNRQVFLKNLQRYSPGIVIAVSSFAVAFCSYGIFHSFDASTTTSYSRMCSFLFAIVFMMVAIALLKSKGLAKPHWVYLLVGCSLGLFLCFNLPAVTAISPDDQIHFDRALSLSYLGDTYYSLGDYQMVAVPWVSQSIVDFDSVSNWISKCNLLHAESCQYGTWLEGPIFVSPVSGSMLDTIALVAYVPSAFGLFLSRLLCLSLSSSIILGRVCNLLVYVAIVALAVRVAPRYKAVFCMVGLIPSSIFLASNFSYDSWITEWSILGFAMTLRFSLDRDGDFNLADLIGVVLVFSIALCAKAIYLLVLFAVLLIPICRSAGNSHKSCSFKTTVLFVSAASIVMFLSFIVPMLLPTVGSGSGDMRGGDAVNSSEQIAYILHNPFAYLQTLLKFSLTYLSPIASDGYTLNYAYMGNVVYKYKWLCGIPFICLLLFSVLGTRDKGPIRKSVVIVKSVLVISCLVSVALVATALYISFTPVGLDRINGCQPRYLIPLLLPMLLCLAFGKRGSDHWAIAIGVFVLFLIVADYSCVFNCDCSRVPIFSLNELI